MNQPISTTMPSIPTDEEWPATAAKVNALFTVIIALSAACRAAFRGAYGLYTAARGYGRAQDQPPPPRRARGARMNVKTALPGQNVEHDVFGIKGLSLMRAAIPQETAEQIVRNLQENTWKAWNHMKPFSRQDFGYDYVIGDRNITPTTAIPEEMKALFPALRAAGWESADPTQLIVTRYPRKGSLGRHIDAPVFGPEIAGVSLETEWPIIFNSRRSGGDINIPLPVLSIYVMRGEARTNWFHRIPPTVRDARISLTFRTLRENNEPTPRPRSAEAPLRGAEPPTRTPKAPQWRPKR